MNKKSICPHLKPLVVQGLLFWLLLIIYTNSVYAGETNAIVAAGEKEFLDNCAICHGADGKGKGPFAPMLVYPPADLTRMKTNNDSSFPFLASYLIIDGREMEVYHGTKLMPIWGQSFREEESFKGRAAEASTLVRGRILELIMYLYAIQAP